MPCPRPRLALRGRYPTAYYPKPYQLGKEAAAEHLTKIRERTYDSPVCVWVRFYCPRPKKTVRLLPPGDIDNHLKSLFDALTAAEWWTDAVLVQQVSARKVWATDGLAPQILFDIQPLIPEEEP